MNPRVLVCEWIPFGENQIVGLNDKLGSLDRCQGGMFTATVDHAPANTKYAAAAGASDMGAGSTYKRG